LRYIDYEKIVETVKGLCISAAYELEQDVLAALEDALNKESNKGAREILKALIENAELARTEMIPLCQDTGLAVVFVEQGSKVAMKPPGDKSDATIIDAINAGVEAGYKDGYLRKSVVAEPLGRRKNTGTNTPAIIHYTVVNGDKLKITVLAKGGGSENRCQYAIFKPTVEPEQIIEWAVKVVEQAGADACPPFVVGVGMGGNFETSCILSKKALCRQLGSRHPDGFYAQLEADLLERINKLGLGPQGMGGDTTALAVMVEVGPCHIASLPVAVNIECHSHRHKTVVV
jgi:fumarate hydratase subunit alpha